MLSKYSEINTDICMINFKILEKKFSINIKKMNNKNCIDKILKMIKKYYTSIHKADILIPKLISIKIKSKKIICRMEYQGQNLIKKNPNFFLHKKNLQNINQILEILYNAKKKKITLDPHIKNFVINDKKKIFYVDIFPPYAKDYEILRAKYYTTNNEKYICQKNFSFFKSKNILYHFVADLIRINKFYLKKINFFYEKFYQAGEIKSKKFFFKKKIFEIIRIEELRLKKNYFLI